MVDASAVGYPLSVNQLSVSVIGYLLFVIRYRFAACKVLTKVFFVAVAGIFLEICLPLTTDY